MDYEAQTIDGERGEGIGPGPADTHLSAWTDEGAYPAVVSPDKPASDYTNGDFIPAKWEIGLYPTNTLEPCFQHAFDVAIEELWSAAERVQSSKQSLARASDPLGLTDGDGNTAEDPETNAPTAERIAGKAQAESFTVSNTSAGRSRDDATAWRIVPIVEQMMRRGQISQEAMEAGRLFYRDFYLGHKQRGVTASWGEMVGSGLTPIGQQRDDHLSPEDRKAQAMASFVGACAAIGVVKCRVTNNRLPSVLLHWCIKIICEDYVQSTDEVPTLELAGRAYLHCKCRKQAMAAGATMIKSGLDRLVSFYGL